MTDDTKVDPEKVREERRKAIEAADPVKLWERLQRIDEDVLEPDYVPPTATEPVVAKTPDRTIAFFAQLIDAVPSMKEQAREQGMTVTEAAEVFFGHLQNLAHLYLVWSELPSTPCPNSIVTSFKPVEVDGLPSGLVEVILRRVLPNGIEFTELVNEHTGSTMEVRALRAEVARLRREIARMPLDLAVGDMVKMGNGVVGTLERIGDAHSPCVVRTDVSLYTAQLADLRVVARSGVNARLDKLMAEHTCLQAIHEVLRTIAAEAANAWADGQQDVIADMATTWPKSDNGSKLAHVLRLRDVLRTTPPGPNQVARLAGEWLRGYLGTLTGPDDPRATVGTVVWESTKYAHKTLADPELREFFLGTVLREARRVFAMGLPFQEAITALEELEDKQTRASANAALDLSWVPKEEQ